MSETNKDTSFQPSRDILEKIPHIVANPWLYDSALSEEDCMFYKIKGTCHQCGISVRFHRDDCIFSMNQLLLSSISFSGVNGFV